MDEKPLAAVDLNLLVALDTLLSECSVSRAARRLSLTQSALSRALGRLRDTFGDELFVRTGHGMRPTRFARELEAPLRRTLADLETLLTRERAFDPRSAARRFRVAGVDYAALALLGPLSRALEQAAPEIDLVLRPHTLDADRELESGELDLLLEPRRAAGAGIVWSDLYDDRYVGLVARDHPAVGFSLREFAASSHVFVAPWGRSGGVVDEALAARGLSRRVAAQVPSFLLVPEVLLGTRRVATVPERMAKRLSALHPLRVVELPVAVPGFTMCMAWHELHRHDAGHAWLRAELSRAGRAFADARSALQPKDAGKQRARGRRARPAR